MNFLSRQDRMLLGGFALAMAVVFARPIQYLFDLARDVERNSGLALVPALIILTVVFVFHQQGKRQEAKARATAGRSATGSIVRCSPRNRCRRRSWPRSCRATWRRCA